jgi:hypothetical protein
MITPSVIIYSSISIYFTIIKTQVTSILACILYIPVEPSPDTFSFQESNYLYSLLCRIFRLRARELKDSPMLNQWKNQYDSIRRLASALLSRFWLATRKGNRDTTQRLPGPTPLGKCIHLATLAARFSTAAPHSRNLDHRGKPRILRFEILTTVFDMLEVKKK